MTGLVVAQLTTDRPVRVAEPPSSAESRRLCTALTTALPARLGQLAARTVEGDRQVTAAWGDPPVTLRCGTLAAPTPLGQVLSLDGVDWAPVTDRNTVTWTSVGRRATVEVRVPRRYDNQAPLLAELSPAITQTLPQQS